VVRDEPLLLCCVSVKFEAGDMQQDTTIFDDNIKMDLKDIMYGDVDLVHLAHDADHW
jgi:hypothetical protein